MTVTGVGPSTQNVGLAEIQVFGTTGTIQTTLSVAVAPLGSGSITISPSKSSYNFGEQVTLTAAPNAGYGFNSWSGGVTSTVNPLTITMTANTSVTANFGALVGSLSITPTAGLSASGSPGGPFTPQVHRIFCRIPGMRRLTGAPQPRKTG